MVVTIREYYTHFIITNLDLVWMSILVQVFWLWYAWKYRFNERYFRIIYYFCYGYNA